MRRFLTAMLFAISALSRAEGVTDFIVNPAEQYVINVSGVYRLAAAANFGAGPYAILVNADNVTVDLNGHTLSGGGIDIPADHPVVRNGTISGVAGRGVRAGGAADAQITGVRVLDARDFGISAGNNARIEKCDVRGVTGTAGDSGAIGGGAYGISSGSKARIEDCSVSEVLGGAGGAGSVGGSAGGLLTGPGSTITRCDLSDIAAGVGGGGAGTGGNGGFAFGLDGGSGSTVRECSVSYVSGGNGGVGGVGNGSVGSASAIQVATGGVVRGCRVVASWEGYGIHAFGFDTVIEDNVLHGYGVGTIGIFVQGAECIVRENRTFQHTLTGIWIVGDGNLCELNRANDIIQINGLDNTIGSGPTANVDF